MAKKKKSSSTPNRNFTPILTVLLVISLSLFAYVKWATTNKAKLNPQKTQENIVQVVKPINLPKPNLSSRTSVESAMQSRRTARNFTETALTLKLIGQMLWAGQGVTADWGGRTAPSAKSAYPLTLYLVASKIDGLDSGLYKYIPGEHEILHQLVLVKLGDLKAITGDSVGQNAAKEAPAVVFITGDMEKMAKAFDDKRNDNNVYLEAGHAAQNMYLQAESLGLGMVTMAGFNGEKVKEVLSIPTTQTIIYAIPLGFPKK